MVRKKKLKVISNGKPYNSAGAFDGSNAMLWPLDHDFIKRYSTATYVRIL